MGKRENDIKNTFMNKQSRVPNLSIIASNQVTTSVHHLINFLGCVHVTLLVKRSGRGSVLVPLATQ